MRTPSLPVLPPASPFKHPQNALKPASQAAFGPFLVPSPPHPFKRPSNGVQTPFKPASVKRLQADVAFEHKKRPSAGPKRKADVKQTSSSWTIRFAPPFLYLPISQPFPPFPFGHFVLRAPSDVRLSWMQTWRLNWLDEKLEDVGKNRMHYGIQR